MNAKETAILFVEFQNEFCKEGGKLFDMVKDEINRQNTLANAVKLADGAREKGCLIVHSPFVFNEKWAKEIGADGIFGATAESGAFRQGEWGSQIIDELEPKEGDVVLQDKYVLSAFRHTGLDDILKDKGIKNVICTGFLTNLCMESSARSAYDLGYKVRIAKDATACPSKDIQDYLEEQLFWMLGGTVTVDEFLNSLE